MSSVSKWHEYVLKHFSTTDDRNTTIQDWFQSQYENENFEGVHFNYIYNTLVTNAEGFNCQVLLLTLLSQAVVVDISLPLRQATYLIEGDGPIALFLIDMLARCQLSLSTCWETMDFPNVRYFIAANLEEEYMPPEPFAPLIPIEEPNEAWIQFCKQTAQPCYDYFRTEVMNHSSINLYRAARIANPEVMKNTPKNAAAVRDAVRPLQPKLVSNDLIDRMIEELADYQIACIAINWERFDISEKIKAAEEFWSSHKKLKAWTEFAHKCMLLQPSSACVERAFSILKYIFDDQSASSLHDYVETSLMLSYNRRSLSIIRVIFKYML